jgi:hypothetical protein
MAAGLPELFAAPAGRSTPSKTGLVHRGGDVSLAGLNVELAVDLACPFKRLSERFN